MVVFKYGIVIFAWRVESLEITLSKKEGNKDKLGE